MRNAVHITGSQFVLMTLVPIIQTNVDVRRLAMAADMIQFPGTKAAPPVKATEPEVRSVSIFEYFEMLRSDGLHFKPGATSDPVCVSDSYW